MTVCCFNCSRNVQIFLNRKNVLWRGGRKRARYSFVIVWNVIQKLACPGVAVAKVVWYERGVTSMVTLTLLRVVFRIVVVY